MIEKITLYFRLLRQRDWRAIYYRLQLLFRQIDLKNVYLDELNLSEECAYEYADSGGDALEKVLDSFGITSRDAIIDFGCGKGGALISLAKYPFSKITGVEISAALIDIARRNLRKLRIDNVNMEQGDASEYLDLDGYNFFYFFNPFPCPVMERVIGNISKSLLRKQRKVTIIYLNPECHGVIIADSPFSKQAEFDHPTLRYYIYSNANEENHGKTR
ncbi:MAG: class I SAM-dependent methyltransferase [Sedimentisphaerales bacterium]